jgi:hypothetical protein
VLHDQAATFHAPRLGRQQCRRVLVVQRASAARVNASGDERASARKPRSSRERRRESRQCACEQPGQRLEQIAAELGTASHDLKLPVIKLLSSKTLTKKGEKRGTMYFAGGGGARATKAKTKRSKKK